MVGYSLRAKNVRSFNQKRYSHGLLSYPINLPQAAPAPQPRTSKRPRSSDARPWILFIEDRRDHAEEYSDDLQRSGFNVLTAPNGQQGCDKARHVRPDLIVVDLMLPDVDGWEVCARLRRDPSTTMIPIVMLTARAEREVRERSREVGCAGFLTKPCDAETLAGELKRVLGRD